MFGLVGPGTEFLPYKLPAFSALYFTSQTKIILKQPLNSTFQQNHSPLTLARLSQTRPTTSIMQSSAVLLEMQEKERVTKMFY